MVSFALEVWRGEASLNSISSLKLPMPMHPKADVTQTGTGIIILGSGCLSVEVERDQNPGHWSRDPCESSEASLQGLIQASFLSSPPVVIYLPLQMLSIDLNGYGVDLVLQDVY